MLNFSQNYSVSDPLGLLKNSRSMPLIQSVVSCIKLEALHWCIDF